MTSNSLFRLNLLVGTYLLDLVSKMEGLSFWKIYHQLNPWSPQYQEMQ